MQYIVKTIITVAVVLLCTAIGKKFPSLAGLIAVMPLTGALVLVWLYSDTGGDPDVMRNYAKGALWGILPSIMFFIVAFFCFQKRLALSTVLSASFAVWAVLAFLHQLLLRQ